MASLADALFNPFSAKGLNLSNRIVMAPMTRDFSPDGVPGENVVNYYRRRAEGGVGLIITEGTTIDHHAASQSSSHPAFHGTAALAGWSRVVEAVHAAGGKIAPQLWHVGMMRNAGRPKGDRVPAVGPSGMNIPGRVVGEPMTDREIADVIDAFARGAASAKQIGFDAVELHGAHGYLIDQFFWAGTNIRQDAWGYNRAKFGIEAVKAVRSAVGPDFPIILRISQWKQQDFSQRLAQTPNEWEQFITPFVDAGVDIFHCSTRRFWEPEFDGSDMNLAGWTKRITGRPTITVGSVGLNGSDFVGSLGGKTADVANIDELLVRLDNGEFDLVAIGRALIANPDWPSRVKSGEINRLHPFDKALLDRLE
ncbi:MAG: NADH:flavin oxidoreductase [Rhizobiales bacterium]|nr:NADH:flavin oxidoreductase [Hyphomicrobiales bacterium]